MSVCTGRRPAATPNGPSRFKKRHTKQKRMADVFAEFAEHMRNSEYAKAIALLGRIEDEKLRKKVATTRINVGGDKKTPLLIASEAGSLDLVKAILATGANINRKSGEDGSTALHGAVGTHGTADIVKYLLDNGADPNATDNDGETPLDVLQYVLNIEGSTPTTMAMRAALRGATQQGGRRRRSTRRRSTRRRRNTRRHH